MADNDMFESNGTNDVPPLSQEDTPKDPKRPRTNQVSPQPDPVMSTPDHHTMQQIQKQLKHIDERMDEIEQIIPNLERDMVHLVQTDSMVIADNMDQLKRSFANISTEGDWTEIRRLEHYDGQEAAFQYVKRLYEKAGQEARTGTMLITMLNTAMDTLQEKIKFLFNKERYS